jgi:VanZ family protein
LEHRKEGLRTPPDQSASGRPSRAASTTDRRRLARWWPAIACSALLLYGSLLPFDINPPALTWADGFGLSRIGFHDASLEDAVVNLLIYLPLGLSVAAGISVRRARRTSAEAPPLEKGGLGGGRIVIAVALSAAFSIAIEAMQTLSPSHVASWTDVALNTLGAAIGALLAVGLDARMHSMIRRLAQALTDRPFNTAAFVLTLGLFAYNLAPFDFVTTTRDLHASFGRARIIPIRLPDPSAAIVQATHWVGEMQGAAWFLVMGYLLALAGRENGRHPAAAFTSALKQGVGLAGLIEFMQPFTRSHSFDAFSIVLRAIGVAFGAWCVVRGVPRGRGITHGRHSCNSAPAPL